MKVLAVPVPACAALGRSERRNGSASAAPAPWRKNRLERRFHCMVASLHLSLAEGVPHHAGLEHGLDRSARADELVAEGDQLAAVGLLVLRPAGDELEVVLDHAGGGL